ECIKRDVKGMYKKALAGEIKQFTGVSDPYEPPPNPELTVRTMTETAQQSAQRVLEWVGWTTVHSNGVPVRA
ncbi:MAG: adenylyl-sulfate kinase, partial [Candidatus Omnitrophota bacterium]|nr:adenylyl-sulfate kinase [Candidatus Omnitrophota bacterium]